MKKLIIIISCFLIIILFLLLKTNNNTNNNEIVVAEVTHSVFYAPWYVSLNNDYFDDLNIKVILTSGANNVISALLSGDANIGLCGPEAVIYNYENKDHIKIFSALTKRDGQFLILRNNIKYSNINDLSNKTILAGRAGGMPLLSFTKVIKDIPNIIIDSSIDFASLSAAYIGGLGDGVNLFEPNATKLVNEGYGYIAESIGLLSDPIIYTTFNAKESFLKNNNEVINKFITGINKGLEFVQTHSSKEIADVIKEEFNDLSYEELVKMIDNYKNADSWWNNYKINISAYNNLLETIDKKEIPYKEIVYDIN